MKKMKLTKLLPAALALMLMSTAVYAEDQSNSAQSVMTLNLAPYIKITTSTAAVSSDTGYGQDYGSITINTDLAPTFKVINNDPSRVIYLKGTAPVSGSGTTNALYGGADGSDMKIVFTNTSNAPADTSVQNITSGSPTASSNPNAIAFSMASTITPQENTGAENPASVEFSEEDGIKYPIKNGIYDFAYNITGDNITNTFDTNDTNGTYQATLTLTTAQP